MVLRRPLGTTVLEAAVDRMRRLYGAGHRIVVSFSAGKDSGICLEVCRLAAEAEGCLPIEAIMRDEEIMLPGTFEYAERVAARPEVRFHWIYANQPIINVFNRFHPYWWVFDPELRPEQWVRRPPEHAYKVEDKNIAAMTTPERFPPEEGRTLYAVIGLRVQESTRRRYAVHSSKGYLTKPNKQGVRNCRPVYDWTEGDVWKATKDHGWDYNSAYDVMYRTRVPARIRRIAPPSMTAPSLELLRIVAHCWPDWWHRVCERLPGMRIAVQYGKHAVQPIRQVGESWEQCFERTCLGEDIPEWIRERAAYVRYRMLSGHHCHSSTPFPEVKPCHQCQGGTSLASWKVLAYTLYNGDPFCLKTDSMGLPYMEPEFFRAGSGTWGGKPTW